MRVLASDGRVNPYWLMEELFGRLRESDTVVTGNASAALISMQAGQTKRGQRVFSNQGCGAMGYGLPAAIGAAIAGGGDRRVICLVGTAQSMMNLQELQTLAYHQLPVVVVVLNNGGYASIQQIPTQLLRKAGGCDPAHGVSFPDFLRIAEACGMPARRISGPDFTKDLDSILRGPGPVSVDALVDGAQGFEPRITSTRLPDGRFVSAEPDDMFPFLSPEERASFRFPEKPPQGGTKVRAGDVTGPLP